MQPARIAELLEPFLGPAKGRRLTTDDLHGISTYIDLLLRWNARVNLTAVRDPEEIVTRHFGESLFAARHLFSDPSAPSAVADLGSGAGFPGLPIKLWAPHVSMTLIESNHKKAAFLREAIRALRLTNVNVQTARAETLPAASFDLVTLRAVEKFAAALPAAAGLVRDKGRMALFVGQTQLDRILALLPHFTWSTPRAIPLSKSRILLIGHPPDAPGGL